MMREQISKCTGDRNTVNSERGLQILLLLVFLKSSPLTAAPTPRPGRAVLSASCACSHFTLHGPRGNMLLLAEPRGQAEQTLRVPAHPGSQAPWGEWHVVLVVRWAEGPPVALSGGRDASKTGLDLSPGVSCRSELQGRICAPGGGQRAGGWLHSPPGSGPPPLCGYPARQQSTDGYKPRF